MLVIVFGELSISTSCIKQTRLKSQNLMQKRDFKTAIEEYLQTLTIAKRSESGKLADVSRQSP